MIFFHLVGYFLLVSQLLRTPIFRTELSEKQIFIGHDFQERGVLGTRILGIEAFWDQGFWEQKFWDKIWDRTNDFWGELMFGTQNFRDEYLSVQSCTK